jgi:hypothetical protein
MDLKGVNAMKKLEVKLSIDTKRVVDLFVTACEGGSNYWCKELTPKGTRGDAYEAMLGGFTLIEKENGKKHTVTPKDIVEALELFPVKYPRQFGDFLFENDDAETGDVFLQLCVFKDVVYG